ncbi:exported hypothetical protein [Verrucomicrobia bacterium]|nr:exported hypothetical protein [Verrucomicrobiota bacterium]
MQRVRNPAALAVAALGLVAAGCIGWQFLPAATKAEVIRRFRVGDAYSTYNRLSGMLKLGTSDEVVRAILGPPDTEQDVPGGRRWIYEEAGQTTGWVCIVDFALSEGTPRLSYFCNVQHLAFPKSLHREFGSPLDSGKFEALPLLQERRSQWRSERVPDNGRSSSGPHVVLALTGVAAS